MSAGSARSPIRRTRARGARREVVTEMLRERCIRTADWSSENAEKAAFAPLATDR